MVLGSYSRHSDFHESQRAAFGPYIVLVAVAAAAAAAAGEVVVAVAVVAKVV